MNIFVYSPFHQFDRKQGAMSKRETSILMRTCRCHKLPKKALGESVLLLASQGDVDVHNVNYMFITLPVQCPIMWCTEKSLFPAAWLYPMLH